MTFLLHLIKYYITFLLVIDTHDRVNQFQSTMLSNQFHKQYNSNSHDKFFALHAFLVVYKSIIDNRIV